MASKWIGIAPTLPEGLVDALDGVTDVLEVVSTILEVVSSILELIKIFLIDVTNPLLALLQALLLIVEQLLEDLSHTGLYLYSDTPNSDGESYGSNLKGGMDAWRSRMTYALLSPNVANRPNFSSGASVVTLHIVVTSGGIGELLASLGFLSAMFKQKATPNMNSAKNFSVRSINSDFYNDFYDTEWGYISQGLINAKQEYLIENSAQLTEDFQFGGEAVDAEDLELVLRFDWLTGEELIMDKTSGAVLTTGGTPDAALLTWKLDQNLIPIRFRIERTENKEGALETYDVLDSAGGVISSGELVTDDEGEPIREDSTLVEIKVPFGSRMTGEPYEQFSYLDENVEAGKAYWYRVIPGYAESPDISVPEMNGGASDILKKLIKLIRSIQKATKGEGTPTEAKSVYIPVEGDLPNVRSVVLSESIKTGGGWWMSNPDLAAEGWANTGIGDLFEPVILAVESLRNFIEMHLASLEGNIEHLIQFIELLQTKINTLNTFIEILQAIIELFKIFELFEFKCLFVASQEGNQGILEAVLDETLEGVPVVGTDDYVGSFTILGGTGGVGSALDAIKLLFGIA